MTGRGRVTCFLLCWEVGTSTIFVLGFSIRTVGDGENFKAPCMRIQRLSVSNSFVDNELEFW